MKRALLILNIVALLGLGASTTYFFTKYQDEREQNSLTTEQKNERLVSEINKVFDLPEETPVVAVVTDPGEFKKQYTTFDNAESGDYLLFFRKARLNVLYRQSEKRVVKTATVVVPIGVELVGSAEAIAKAEQTLAEFGNQIQITKTVKEGVTQSFVFDLDDDQKEQAASIAKQLGIDVGTTLPSAITPADQIEIVVAVSSTTSSAPADTAQQP